MRPGRADRTGLREHGRAGRARNRAFLPDDHVGDCDHVPRHCQRVFTASGLDREGSQADTAKFPNGNSRINHPGPASGAPEVNPATCFVTFTGPGRFTISGGTRAYKGISGSGKVVISLVGILGRTKSGACSENGKPAAWQQTYRGTAHIKL